jgi:hypothetical protein
MFIYVSYVQVLLTSWQDDIVFNTNTEAKTSSVRHLCMSGDLKTV